MFSISVCCMSCGPISTWGKCSCCFTEGLGELKCPEPCRQRECGSLSSSPPERKVPSKRHVPKNLDINASHSINEGGSLHAMLLSFSCPVMSNVLQPHGLQHTRTPCPSPSPIVCPSSCPLNRRCHLAISSSDTLFSFCPQSFPGSGTFLMS